MRSQAREDVFKIIFSEQFTGENDGPLKRALYKNDKLTQDDIEYADRVLKIVNEHYTEFTELIDKTSLMFPESRLFPADKSVIILALAEILYMDDIPAPVSINEAANIASKYSTEKSASFVSGILAEVVKK